MYESSIDDADEENCEIEGISLRLMHFWYMAG